MRITLVNPIGDRGAHPDIFMSVLYLGTALKNAGHDVKIIDAQIEDTATALKHMIKKSDVIGFSVMTTQLKDAIRLSDMVKENDSSVPVIWGGVHPTFFPQQTVSDKSVDYVIYGEGENTLVEMVEYLSGKGKLSEIKGISYLKNGKPHITESRPFLDLNSLSPPAWDLLNMEKYVHDFSIGKENYGKLLPVHSGRGCVHRCAFCINALNKRRWRPLTTEKIINEIKILKDKYDINYIKFVDENFFTDRHRVEEFCKDMIKENLDIRWHATGKASYFNKKHMNDRLLKLAKKSGCAVISMGIESGSQKMLNYMKKDITIADTIRAVRTCEKFGIKSITSFMMGLPHETRDDLLKTLDMIKKIKKISPDSMVIGPQVFRPYPGCEIYEEIKNFLNEPSSLREWAKTDMIGGYMAAKYLPWVKDPAYLENIWFYLNRSAVEPPTLTRQIIEGIFKEIAQFRVKHNMFGFAVDKKMFEIIEALYFRRKVKK